VVLGNKTGPLMEERLSEGGLKALCILKKWKTEVFPCSKTSPNFVRREKVIL